MYVYVCIGSIIFDTVSKNEGEVLGCASNPNKRHAHVSVRSTTKGIIADVPISRLELVKT